MHFACDCKISKESKIITSISDCQDDVLKCLPSCQHFLSFAWVLRNVWRVCFLDSQNEEKWLAAKTTKKRNIGHDPSELSERMILLHTIILQSLAQSVLYRLCWIMKSMSVGMFFLEQPIPQNLLGQRNMHSQSLPGTIWVKIGWEWHCQLLWPLWGS